MSSAYQAKLEVLVHLKEFKALDLCFQGNHNVKVGSTFHEYDAVKKSYYPEMAPISLLLHRYVVDLRTANISAGSPAS